ncbi:MAG: PorP/SprF family type IX secretion system membrane protein [Prevotellaceae bacterium]|nr:PorP/SprF family type IX secretion system membrane protein [Prevotellaceae bacterium]
MRRTQLVILFLLISTGFVFAQQDMLYSQYVFHSLAINPAYAGYKEAVNANIFTRLQWLGIPGSPKIYSAIVDGVATEGKNVGWAGQLASDTKGASNTFSAYATYAFRLALNRRKDRLAFGISAGLSYQLIDRDKLVPYELQDPTLANLQGEARPDFRFGVFYNTPAFYAGLSITNIFANFTYAKKIPHLYFSLGGLLKLSEAVALKPTLLLREDFNGPTNMDLNLFGIFADRVWLGVGYRTGIPFKGNLESIDKLTSTNAMSFLAQIYATQSLLVGYSYDHNLNGWPATQEISVSYTFKQRYNRLRNPRHF